MLKEKKEQEVELIIDVAQIAQFSDNVFFEAKPDVVTVNFTQSMPKPIPDPSGANRSQAKVISSIVLTVPHFLRFASVCGEIAKNITEKTEESKQ